VNWMASTGKHADAAHGPQFQLWYLGTASLIHTYPTEATALAFVREWIGHAQPPECIGTPPVGCPPVLAGVVHDLVRHTGPESVQLAARNFLHCPDALLTTVRHHVNEIFLQRSGSQHESAELRCPTRSAASVRGAADRYLMRPGAACVWGACTDPESSPPSRCPAAVHRSEEQGRAGRIQPVGLAAQFTLLAVTSAGTNLGHARVRIASPPDSTYSPTRL
jgi:hypothetical protein